MADAYRGAIEASTMIAPRDVAEVVRMTTRLSAACILPEVVLLRPTGVVAARGGPVAGEAPV
ncbi:MAG: hypothetical protein PGN37_08435 [Mycobacterium kyogaense]|uniref:hypothetical protein n=1 Tax=Mycobacterium kyogaense TaxID=2212479 RepID=UPI002FFAC2D2